MDTAFTNGNRVVRDKALRFSILGFVKINKNAEMYAQHRTLIKLKTNRSVCYVPGRERHDVTEGSYERDAGGDGLYKEVWT